MGAPIRRPVLGALLPEQVSDDADWQALRALARLIRVDPASGTVTVAHGQSSITLHADGTVRIEARRILQSADEDILLSAARVDLN